MAAPGATPVTIVCALPGARTEPFVERVLADPRYGDTAVVASAGALFTGPAGCLCCRVASELVARLRELHFARATGAVPRFRRVIVEARGAGDPASILATLAELPLVAARYAPAGIVAVAPPGTEPARDRESLRRIALADRVVPMDLGHVADALDIDPYDPGQNAATPEGAAPGSFVWEGGPASSADAFGAALEALVARHGERILKLAGSVEVAGLERRMGVLGVGHTLFAPAWLGPAPGRPSGIRFTARGLEEAAAAQMLNPSAPAPSQNSGLRHSRADHGRDR